MAIIANLIQAMLEEKQVWDVVDNLKPEFITAGQIKRRIKTM